jgi:hypothetical protein
LLSTSGCSSNAEDEAVSLCFELSARVEAERIGAENFKATQLYSYHTQKFGEYHLLVKVNYLVITMDDPVQDVSENVILPVRAITCEVKDGKVVDVAVLGSISDQALRRIGK